MSEADLLSMQQEQHRRDSEEEQKNFRTMPYDSSNKGEIITGIWLLI